MFGSLRDRRVVVTGASTGIGAAVARECAAAGADIVGTWRTSQADAEQVADEIRALGRPVELFQLDMTSVQECETFVGFCRECGPVDAAVLNAGADLLTGPLKDADYLSRLQALLDVDVRGTVALGRAFGRLFQNQGRGSIITVGWDQSDRGMEGDSGELFSTAKNAIMGFSRSLALSLAPEVRVNCVAPGWILTEWGSGAGEYWQQRVLRETPLRRWGTPKDVAGLVRFLLSDDAAWITGQVININGGAVR